MHAPNICTPIADHNGTIFVAIELSQKTWLGSQSLCMSTAATRCAPYGSARRRCAKPPFSHPASQGA